LDVQAAQKKERMVAHDNRHRRGLAPFMIAPAQLPAMARSHVEPQPVGTFVHVPLKSQIVEGALRIPEHGHHVQIRGGIHLVMPDQGQITEVRIFARPNDFMDRGIPAGQPGGRETAL